MYCPGEPSREAPLETLTMAPPAPPCFVLMRRTASRAQRKLPMTLMRNMRSSRATLISSTRAGTSTMPALLTSAVRRPSLASTFSNMASTWASSPTSACTDMAVPPPARMPRTTSSAASELLA